MMQGVSVQTNCISSSSSGVGLVPYANLAGQDTVCGNALLAIVNAPSNTANDLSSKLALVTNAHDGIAYVKQLQSDAASTATGTIGALHTHLTT